MITTIRRRMATPGMRVLSVMAVCLLWLNQTSVLQASEIGSGDTSVTVAAVPRMSDAVSFNITQGNPAVIPATVVANQTVTTNFHVTLSWPDDAAVSGQQQD